MEPPRQPPPVDRRYMRYVVGKRGTPVAISNIEEGQKSRRRSHKGKSETTTVRGGNFIVELTVFHFRPYPRRGS
jgi:hypothetical protein